MSQESRFRCIHSHTPDCRIFVPKLRPNETVTRYTLGIEVLCSPNKAADDSESTCWWYGYLVVNQHRLSLVKVAREYGECRVNGGSLKLGPVTVVECGCWTRRSEKT